MTDLNLFKNHFIKKLNESIIKDFDYIRDLKIVIIYKNSWKFELKELVEFLKHIKYNKKYCNREDFVNNVYELLLSFFIDKQKLRRYFYYRRIEDDIPKDYKYSPAFYFQQKIIACIDILQRFYDIQNIKESNLTDEKKLIYMFRFVYKNYKSSILYDFLVKSNKIFFGNSKADSPTIFVNRSSYTKNFKDIYIYSEVKSLSLECNEFPISLEQNLKKISLKILNDDEFIKTPIELYKNITYSEFCKKYPHVKIPVNLLPVDLLPVGMLSNKLFNFASMNENYPHCDYAHDSMYVFKNEDIYQNAKSLEKINSSVFVKTL